MICCGAPISLIDSKTALILGRDKLNELLESVRETNINKVVMACPCCYSNIYNAMQKFGVKEIQLYDIASYIVTHISGGD